jgi:hypothetical protein
MYLDSTLMFPSKIQSPPPLAKKSKKLNQPPSGLRSGWDSAIKDKAITPANNLKSNTEEADNSPEQYGGMIGDDEDDEVERSVVVNDKKPKRGPSNYVSTISLILVGTKLTVDHSVIIYKDRSGGIHTSHTTRSPWWKWKKMET